MHYAAVGDFVLLAFQPQLAEVARAAGLAAARDVIVYAMVSVRISHTLEHLCGFRRAPAKALLYPIWVVYSPVWV